MKDLVFSTPILRKEMAKLAHLNRSTAIDRIDREGLTSMRIMRKAISWVFFPLTFGDDAANSSPEIVALQCAKLKPSL